MCLCVCKVLVCMGDKQHIITPCGKRGTRARQKTRQKVAFVFFRASGRFVDKKESEEEEAYGPGIRHHLISGEMIKMWWLLFFPEPFM